MSKFTFEFKTHTHLNIHRYSTIGYMPEEISDEDRERKEREIEMKKESLNRRRYSTGIAPMQQASNPSPARGNSMSKSPQRNGRQSVNNGSGGGGPKRGNSASKSPQRNNGSKSTSPNQRGEKNNNRRASTTNGKRNRKSLANQDDENYKKRIQEEEKEKEEENRRLEKEEELKREQKEKEEEIKANLEQMRRQAQKVLKNPHHEVVYARKSISVPKQTVETESEDEKDVNENVQDIAPTKKKDLRKSTKTKKTSPQSSPKLPPSPPGPAPPRSPQRYSNATNSNSRSSVKSISRDKVDNSFNNASTTSPGRTKSVGRSSVKTPKTSRSSIKTPTKYSPPPPTPWSARQSITSSAQTTQQSTLKSTSSRSPLVEQSPTSSLASTSGEEGRIQSGGDRRASRVIYAAPASEEERRGSEVNVFSPDGKAPRKH